MSPYAEKLISDIAQRINQPLNQSKPLKPAERMVMEKYLPKFEKERLDIGDFINNPYSAEEVKRDGDEEQRLEKKFEKGTLRGKIFEALVATSAESLKWFGENTKVVILSKFDDYKNGDIMLETKNNNGEIVRILVDLTTSVLENEITEKIDKTYELIKKGESGEAKYFKSKLDETIGKVDASARVVIGISPDSLGELCGEMNQTPRQEKNYVQLMFLDEMLNQLIHMAETSKEKNGADHKVTKELEKSLSIIKDLLVQKESLRTHEYEQKAKHDRTYQHLAY